MIKNISNLGDAALYCDFGSEVNKEINSKVIRYFKSIQKENIDGINNLTPSYNKLIISFDLRKKNFQTIKKLIENLNITNDNISFLGTELSPIFKETLIDVNAWKWLFKSSKRVSSLPLTIESTSRYKTFLILCFKRFFIVLNFIFEQYAISSL